MKWESLCGKLLLLSGQEEPHFLETGELKDNRRLNRGPAAWQFGGELIQLSCDTEISGSSADSRFLKIPSQKMIIIVMFGQSKVPVILS